MERLKTMENNKVEQLVEKAIKGNKKAFEEIVRLKFETIMFNALSILKQYQDAEDATQEIILKLYDKIGTLKEPAAFNSWLHRIIVNYCYNMHDTKKSKRESMGMDEYILEREEQDREFLPQIYAEDKDRANMLRGIIGNLPDQRRMIITMYYYDEMSYKEIAYALDMPMNTVASDLKRDKNQIKSELEKIEPINTADINKLAGIPVLSQVLSEQAKEQILPSSFDNIMAFTHKKILADTAAKAAPFTLKKVCVVILCTAVFTTGIVYATGFFNNTNDGNSQDSSSITTENAVNQPFTPTGEVIYKDSDCQCGHVNPKEITVTDMDEAYMDATWTITNIKTNEEIKGEGISITNEVQNLLSQKKDGEYAVLFTLKYPEGNLKMDRDFLIDSGDVAGKYS